MKLLLSLLASFLFATIARANFDAGARSAATTTGLDAIKQTLADARDAHDKAVKSLPDSPDVRPQRVRLQEEWDARESALYQAAVDLARANPKSDTGFEALAWLVTTRQTYYLPVGSDALVLMNQQYSAEPKIAGVLAVLTYYFPTPEEVTHREALALLNAVMVNNADRTARGHAALGLAWQAKKAFQSAEARGKHSEITSLAVKAENAFETVLREYGDCPNLRSVGVAKATPTLGGEAENELRELRTLSIGRMAPDIEGEDLAGTPMKLSETRGKVVLIVFWASWCGPCMSAIPHEKELVERFKGRPFVLIGINGDESKKTANNAVSKNKIPWRSFWNGTPGDVAAIDSAWNVRGWPTVYVLDHQGVIREKYLHGKRLDAPLEKLVEAAEKSAGSTAAGTSAPAS